MSELEHAIERQVMAIEDAPQSVRTPGPAWFESDTGNINEPLLIATLIDEHGLTKAGYRIENTAGQPMGAAQLKKIISDTIGPYIPRGTAQKVDSVYKLLRVNIPEQKAALSFDSFTAADLAAAEIPAAPFAVEHILPCGLTLLAAPPKTGKSWMCLALADAVATGGTFFGYHVNPGAVLYLALEDNKKRLQERLRAIGSTMPENLTMVCRNALCLDNGLIDQLETWINEHPDTRLIILDTLQRIKGVAQRGVDAYSGDYKRLGPLQELAIEKNVAIIAVHHFRKQGNGLADDDFERIAGSTALFGVSDCAWVIKGKRGDEEMKLHVTGREVFDEEFVIKFKNSIWELQGTSEQVEQQRQADAYKKSPLVRTIRELVSTSGGSWTGSATLLMVEGAKIAGEAIAKNTKELHTLVFGIQKMLHDTDGIAVYQAGGGVHGRDYTFSKVQQQSMMNGGANK